MDRFGFGFDRKLSHLLQDDSDQESATTAPNVEREFESAATQAGTIDLGKHGYRDENRLPLEDK